jgi:hypothetical protein
MKEYKNKDKDPEGEWGTMYSQIQSKLEILSTRASWFLQEWFKQDRVSLWGKAKEAIIEWDIDRTENAWWTQIIEYKWIMICCYFFLCPSDGDVKSEVPCAGTATTCPR